MISSSPLPSSFIQTVLGEHHPPSSSRQHAPFSTQSLRQGGAKFIPAYPRQQVFSKACCEPRLLGPTGSPRTVSRTLRVGGAGKTNIEVRQASAAMHSWMYSLDMNLMMWELGSPFILEATEAPGSMSCGSSGSRVDRHSSCRAQPDRRLARQLWGGREEKEGAGRWASLRLRGACKPRCASPLLLPTCRNRVPTVDCESPGSSQGARKLWLSLE